MTVHFTVDVESDCPPYLHTWRGIDEGMPRLLALLADERVPSTFFVTGEVADRHPEVVRAVVDGGHELACHGHTHRSFERMDADEARHEIAESSRVLRGFAPVVSFRAPYLQFPAAFVPLLAEASYRLDSSQGRHKHRRASVHTTAGVLRVPASITSSTLRWPALPRDALLARLRDPIVLFAHPWEYVDLRRERLRFDCRFRTGDEALASTRSALRFFKRRGDRFALMRDCVAADDQTTGYQRKKSAASPA